MHIVLQDKDFWGLLFLVNCKQMATSGVFYKCQKTFNFNFCLKSLATKKSNEISSLNYGRRRYSEKNHNSGLQMLLSVIPV